MPADPTAAAARALVALRDMAADLGAARRENAALRRRMAELEAENARLRADATAPALMHRRGADGAALRPLVERGGRRAG